MGPITNMKFDVELPEDVAAARLEAAVRDVLAERIRQIKIEGWSADYVDHLQKGELARAASLYALNSGLASLYVGEGHTHPFEIDAIMSRSPMQPTWPLAPALWRPCGRRHDLVKAVAMMLAEIVRLDRAALRGAVVQ